MFYRQATVAWAAHSLLSQPKAEQKHTTASQKESYYFSSRPENIHTSDLRHENTGSMHLHCHYRWCAVVQSVLVVFPTRLLLCC